MKQRRWALFAGFLLAIASAGLLCAQDQNTSSGASQDTVQAGSSSQSSTGSARPQDQSGSQAGSSQSQNAPASPSSTPSPQTAGSPPTQNAPAPPTASPDTPAPSDQSAAQSDDKDNKDKKKKSGGKNDVDSIGNRKMGGKGLGNWYSLESEIRMGKEYAQMVESSAKIVQDPVISEYVNRVGQNLVRNSDAKVPFTIKVIDSDEINAFALPGGFFYVNSGLILAADEEAELAGVMAHEIAHVAARHATRQMTRGNMVNIASIPLIFVGGGLGYAVRSAAGIGLPLTFLTFSRGFEAEADYLGVQYMYKAGYDPQAFISFFEKIQAKEKKRPGSLAKAFATHPQTPDRIQKSQEEISKILPAQPQYVVSTSEFDLVKGRLAALENKHKLNDGDKDKNRPSLRRTSTADKTSSDSKKSGEDDRPTLKRRPDDQ
jgi:beta-barrel assembly-enhancing protease